LSTSYAQVTRQTIAAVRFGYEAGCSPDEVDIRDVVVDWQQDAACVHHREVDFFPARGESVRDAKAVCACCPVRVQCLDFALRLKVAHGVWGGLSERERRSLRRERHRATLGERTR
jgi:WhiB family redox-sensing transcriptional regulator